MMNAAHAKVEGTAIDASHEALAQSVVDSFNTLMSGLPREVQALVRTKLAETFPNQQPRAREVLATILKLVPRDRPVTIDDVKKTVESEGILASAKAIANALNYLARKNRITRIGHGRYMVDGVQIVTDEILDAGPPTRDMIDDY